MFHVMFDVRPYLRDLSSMEQLSSMSGFVRSLELIMDSGLPPACSAVPGVY
jgi:hypothetical protein